MPKPDIARGTAGQSESHPTVRARGHSTDDPSGPGTHTALDEIDARAGQSGAVRAADGAGQPDAPSVREQDLLASSGVAKPCVDLRATGGRRRARGGSVRRDDVERLAERRVARDVYHRDPPHVPPVREFPGVEAICARHLRRTGLRILKRGRTRLRTRRNRPSAHFRIVDHQRNGGDAAPVIGCAHGEGR